MQHVKSVKSLRQPKFGFAVTALSPSPNVPIMHLFFLCLIPNKPHQRMHHNRKRHNSSVLDLMSFLVNYRLQMLIFASWNYICHRTSCKNTAVHNFQLQNWHFASLANPSSCILMLNKGLCCHRLLLIGPVFTFLKTSAFVMVILLRWFPFITGIK